MKVISGSNISPSGRWLKLIAASVFGLLTIISCGGGGDATPPPPTLQTPSANKADPVLAATGTFQQIILANRTIGESGVTIEISDTQSPLKGLKIVVPEDAASEDISFEISFADNSNMA